jgi:hypothetical protein
MDKNENSVDDMEDEIENFLINHNNKNALQNKNQFLSTTGKKSKNKNNKKVNKTHVEKTKLFGGQIPVVVTSSPASAKNEEDNKKNNNYINNNNNNNNNNNKNNDDNGNIDSIEINKSNCILKTINCLPCWKLNELTENNFFEPFRTKKINLNNNLNNQTNNNDFDDNDDDYDEILISNYINKTHKNSTKINNNNTNEDDHIEKLLMSYLKDNCNIDNDADNEENEILKNEFDEIKKNYFKSNNLKSININLDGENDDKNEKTIETEGIKQNNINFKKDANITTKNNNKKNNKNEKMESIEKKLSRETCKEKTEDYFQYRVKYEPRQVLRYAYDGKPMWISSPNPLELRNEIDNNTFSQNENRILVEQTNKLIPSCENCGADRVFEMQLMPGLLNFIHENNNNITSVNINNNINNNMNISNLKINQNELLNNFFGDELEFGIVAIYSCSKSCCIVNNNKNKNMYAIEYAVVQNSLDFS